MEGNANLYQKVLSLIIGHHSLEISDSARVELCSDTELQDVFNDLVALIQNKAQTYKPENTTQTQSAEHPTDESRGSFPDSARQDILQSESVSPQNPPEIVVCSEVEPVVDASPEATEPAGVTPDADTILPATIATSSEVDVAPEEGGDQNWQLAPFLPLDITKTVPPAMPEKADMKPGDIPAARANTSAKITRALPPFAKINIANARVGTPFHSEIDISLDNGETARIQNVVFAKEIGVFFDPENSVLKGIPSESGDIEMTVTWSLSHGQTYSDKVIFIVNPDPRSLWKIIEPPAADKYFKANIDHKTLYETEARIAAASRRGRSHEHVGSFRDDDFSISHCPDTGWSIMLVADGAGSAKNSRQGSRIVAETVGQYLTHYFGGDRGRELSELVNRWEPADQQNIGTAFRHQFHQASVMAINNIKNESIAAEETVKSYSTTLLVAVTYRSGEDLFAAAFWMGDGAIAAYGPTGKVRVLGTPDSGEYAGQTRFLDAEAVQDPDFSKRVSIGKWKDISHLILMTDGVSDPFFETDNGLQKAEKWDALVNELSPALNTPDKTSEQLAEWLNFFIPGNHDDRTIVVYW
ncbi:PP2C family serine/threonine-protein phosphatase [Rahnella aceris]|uniref:PP2C family serine/threonine-protein phosphatase n=1 Tax=Rahnella sp. (strain Y9602) TaxID=2703885 RepID=A0ABW6C9R6_RAHSY